MLNNGTKFICLVLVALSFFATSCQKELSTELLSLDSTTTTPVTGNTGDPNGLLVKVDVRGGATATDSSITYYGYDVAKRMVSMKTIGSPVSGTSINTLYTYTRNANGIITQVVEKADALAQQGLDSVITKVGYDATTSHYTNAVITVSYFGFSTIDSSVFVYGASGLSQTIHYQMSVATPTYTPSIRYDYTYTGSQFANMKSYSYNATTASFSALANYAYTLDSKVNPVQTGVDAPIILASPESVNNPTSLIITSSVASSANFSINYTYTYNSANKPATAVIKNTSDNTTKNATYYYQ
jgi:hypothetical protein